MLHVHISVIPRNSVRNGSRAIRRREIIDGTLYIQCTCMYHFMNSDGNNIGEDPRVLCIKCHIINVKLFISSSSSC